MQDGVPQQLRQSDMLDPVRATACLATFGWEGHVGQGDPLPAFFHQLYFWDVQPPQGLGRDGHPKLGGIIPDMGLPRRMWAGGRMEFARPLRAGIGAERLTVLESAERKAGRTGPLAFVTLRHEFRQQGALCLTDWQRLVYREDPDPAAQRPVPPVARMDEDSRETRCFDSTLLFRYSALTFNGHRIHYDEAYARGVEGHDGLVVHGPILAQLLIRKAEAEIGCLRAFAFRATAPVCLGETPEFCRKGLDLWVRGADGRLCMSAVAEV